MIKIEINDSVAELVLAVNKVNALNISDVFSLANLVEKTGRRKDVNVIVLTNDGDSFCAGADIKEITLHPELIGESNRAWHRLVAAVYDCEVPIIAAVDGHCLGGGLALAASCDIIMLSERTVIGLPQVKLGGWGAGTFMMRLLGPMRTRAIALTGRSLSAKELAGCDGIEAILPSDQLRDAARTLAREMAQYPGDVLRMGKAALNGIDPLDLKQSYRFEHAFTTELFVTPEAVKRREERISKGFKG